MSRARSTETLARRFGGGDRPGRRPVEVVVEEPLEIRLGDDLVATTMRTPGHDFELAAGWCWAEGLLDSPPTEIRYCATASAVDTDFNVVTVDPAPGAGRGPGGGSPVSARVGMATASCGICGVEQVDRLTERLEPLAGTCRVPISLLTAAGGAVEAHQSLFTATGGSHAAAALAMDGSVVVVREDIGRHNAVDKVVGRLLLDGTGTDRPAGGLALWVSGRGGFELVQKAWAAGFEALVAVGAPSALAVETADRAGLVLAGFARGDEVTVYAGLDRVADDTAGPGR